MKSVFFSLAMLLMPALTMAGNDANGSNSSNADNNDTTRVYNNMVSRTDYDGNRVWNFNFLSLGIGESVSVTSNVNANVQTNVNVNVDSKGPCKTPHTALELGIENFYVGVSSLADTKGFELKPANSLEFGFDFWNLNHRFRNPNFRFILSAGVSWTRYAIRHDDVFYYDPSGQFVCAPFADGSVNPGDYDRSRLTYASWRFPARLLYKKNGHFVAVGAEAELRHHLRSRIKYGKNSKYYAAAHEMEINPWGCNLLLNYGYRDVSIIARYSLTDFFASGDKCALQGTPFMIGFQFDL